jgi:peroxiredoxin
MDRAGWMMKLAAAIVSGGGVVPFLSGCSDVTPMTAVTRAAEVAATDKEPTSPRRSKPGEQATLALTRMAAKPVTEEYSANVPPVMLAAEHAELCKVNVGDAFPAFELQKIGGGTTALAELRGPKATVVLFWRPDRWMAESALADLSAEATSFAGKGAGFVAIAEGPADGKADDLIKTSGGGLMHLTDADGSAFAQVGEAWLPQVFILDSAGKVAWFDIEYSEATRRELRQTLAELTK